MSKISISSNPSGTATYTITAPAGSTDRTLTLPDAAGAVVIDEAGGGSVKIDSNGNMGIGTSSPAEKIHIDGGAAAGYLKATNNASTQGIEVGISAVGDGIINVQDAAALRLFTSDAERMRIDASGNLLVGTTTVDAAQLKVRRTNTTGDLLRLHNDGAGTSVSFITFRYGAGQSEVGYISTNGTTTAYNTSSDYRLKEDVQPMVGASDRLMALKPVNFAWKVDGSRVDGFLAHEAQEVVPEAVTGTKDSVDADGNPEYQGIDQSKIVPLLTAALQEALTKIEALEARVAQLEGA